MDAPDAAQHLLDTCVADLLAARHTLAGQFPLGADAADDQLIGDSLDLALTTLTAAATTVHELSVSAAGQPSADPQ